MFNFAIMSISTSKSSSSVDLNEMDSIVSFTETRYFDKVYTIGCFDLLHEGHIKLFERMRKLGKQLIIGVHDSKRYN